MSKPSSNTPRSRHVFFLDENLGANRLAEILRAAGFKVVTHRERYGQTVGIKDDRIITDCGATNTILLTADADLETTWAAEITKAKIRAVILSNNTDGARQWGTRLAIGRDALMAQIRRHKKPVAIRFNRQAEITHVRFYGKSKSKVVIVKKHTKKST